MTSDHSIPALRDLPGGRLAERKQHLLAEISRERDPRFSISAITLPRPRRVAFAGAGACAVAGAAALVIVLSGGSGVKRSAFLVQAIHGPAWSAASGANWGGGVTIAPATSPVFATTTQVVGGTPGERTLLRTIIGGMQPTVIEKIETIRGGRHVALHMTAPGTSMRALWEESLVAAAFRDRARAAGANLTVSLYDGVRNRGPIPPGPATPLPSARSGEVAAVRRRFMGAATRIGVSLDTLTIYQPDGIAVAATLKSDNPPAFLAHQMPRFLAALGNRWTGYDGTYIRVVDQNGATVWESSTNSRISSGSVGVRQSLAGCSPVLDWGPTPPPCPAK